MSWKGGKLCKGMSEGVRDVEKAKTADSYKNVKESWEIPGARCYFCTYVTVE